MAIAGSVILVVDDSDDDTSLLRISLRKADITTPLIIITRGDDALDYLSGKKAFADRSRHPLPSVIFLDLKLPDRPGLEILKWINTQPDLKRILVIVHSGIQSQKQIDELYAAGAKSFLQKTGDLNELKTLIQYFKIYFTPPNPA